MNKEDEDMERRWWKVKKLGADGSPLNIMDMQSNGKNHIKKFRH